MIILVDLMIALVAILHFGFLVLEMFLWTKPVGRRIFGLSAEAASSSATLAANQGLYTGFLAVGLVWGIVVGLIAVKIFFLSCVLVAGLFGGLTAKRSILWIQALPAAIALTLVLIFRQP